MTPHDDDVHDAHRGHGLKYADRVKWFRSSDYIFNSFFNYFDTCAIGLAAAVSAAGVAGAAGVFLASVTFTY